MDKRLEIIWKTQASLVKDRKKAQNLLSELQGCCHHSVYEEDIRKLKKKVDFLKDLPLYVDNV